MQPTKDQIQKMLQMNVAHRFHDQAITYEEDPATGRVRPMKGSKAVVVCDIFDKTTGQQFFSAKAPTEGEAFEIALNGAIAAEKPLTPVQRADPRFSKMAEMQSELSAARARIAELEASVVNGSPTTTPPPHSGVPDAPGISSPKVRTFPRPRASTTSPGHAAQMSPAE